jgi:hypothetical protein
MRKVSVTGACIAQNGLHGTVKPLFTVSFLSSEFEQQTKENWNGDNLTLRLLTWDHGNCTLN